MYLISDRKPMTQGWRACLPSANYEPLRSTSAVERGTIEVIRAVDSSWAVAECI